MELKEIEDYRKSSLLFDDGLIVEVTEHGIRIIPKEDSNLLFIEADKFQEILKRFIKWRHFDGKKSCINGE